MRGRVKKAALALIKLSILSVIFLSIIYWANKGDYLALVLFLVGGAFCSRLIFEMVKATKTRVMPSWLRFHQEGFGTRYALFLGWLFTTVGVGTVVWLIFLSLAG